MKKNFDLYGGIEAGGTKFICAVSGNPPLLESEVSINTTLPDETLEKVCEFFYPYINAGRLKSVGLVAFGPVDTNIHSPTYGYITETPKPHWANLDIKGRLEQELGVPFAFHQDVSGSAIGEFRWGAARGLDPSLYLTIGTGIGGMYLINGKPLNGLTVLEMGHIRIPHDLKADPFPGNCPYHGDCFEGLAAGPAIQTRMGSRGEFLTDDDPFWRVEAGYIACALANYILTLSPKIIVVGGGIMQRAFMFELVRTKVLEFLNGYLHHDLLSSQIDQYIVPPALGKYSGVLGAISMAMSEP